MDDVKRQIFATAALNNTVSDKKKQMNDILLNIRDENSSTVTIKVFILLNF